MFASFFIAKLKSLFNWLSEVTLCELFDFYNLQDHFKAASLKDK